MTINESIYQFFNSFGVTAFEENTVPTGAVFPYITYNIPLGTFNNATAGNCNIWTRSTSWTGCINLSDLITKAIGRGGKCIRYTGGAVWVKPGNPFVQNMGDDTDELIRRRYIQLEIEITGD